LNPLSSIVSGVGSLLADVGSIGGAPAPWDDYWYSSVGSPSVAGMRITADTVKRLSTVIACVSAKGRALGVLPCLIYSDLPGGGKKVQRNHPMFRILHERPNSMQTAFEYYQMMQGHIELRGNAYSEIMASRRGVIGELVPMHPDRVRVEMLTDGSLRYQYTDPLLNKTRTLLQDEVHHVRDFADVRQVGQSRISMGMDVYGVALAQQDYRGKFLKNDASSGVVITGTNFETKQDEDLYLKAFEQSNTGDHRHRAKLLPPGVDIKTLGIKPIDMQLLDASKASAVEICTMHNILPHLIGVDTGKAATYASVEQFNLMHAQQSVLPMAVMWEQAQRRDLFSEQDPCYSKFALASLLRGDTATRMAGYAVGVEHGWLSDDDVRELEDMNPIAGGIGKQYFRPLNWTTLDAPVSALPAGPASPDPDPDQEEEEQDDQDSPDNSDPGSDQQQSAMRSRLQLMAHDSAARCVRREVNGARKLIERDAQTPEIGAFYAEHYRFICGVFHFSSVHAIKAKQACDGRLYELSRLISEGALAATAFIEHVAQTEPAKLAALAVEGVI
jgi:HK97 family phage portal protein